MSCDEDVTRRIGLTAGIVRNLHNIMEGKWHQQINKSTTVSDAGSSNNTLQLRHSRRNKRGSYEFL